MTKELMKTRRETIEKLRGYEIEGPLIYLIDIIPLIEMMWADGIAQDSEITIINDYLNQHVDRINRMAGVNILSIETARDFVSKFLRKRPDPELLRTLRSFISAVRLSTSDNAANKAVKNSLLAACLDIASSDATEYPYDLHERFDPAEKRCFFEIIDSLGKDPIPQQT